MFNNSYHVFRVAFSLHVCCIFAPCCVALSHHVACMHFPPTTTQSGSIHSYLLKVVMCARMLCVRACCVCAYVVCIGGWGCESDFSPTPEPGNRFRLRLRLRCVRACERAKLRARDDSSVARGGRTNLWVSVRPSLRPSLRAGPGPGPGPGPVAD